jgi:hypothetical protein
MLKKIIKYVDYDGNNREETHYFNLNKAELAELEFSANGGMEKAIKQIIEIKDRDKIMQIFKEIIRKSYGEKSLDGKYFLKFDENGNRLADKFMQTEAYPTLFVELGSDAKAASDFIEGILPKTE